MEATFYIGDKLICTQVLQSPDINVEVETERKYIKSPNHLKMYSFDKSRTVSIDMRNVKTDMNALLNNYTPYKLIGTGYRLPKGVKLPKTKRLRKKYFKKYGYKIELDNCYIKL